MYRMLVEYLTSATGRTEIVEFSSSNRTEWHVEGYPSGLTGHAERVARELGTTMGWQVLDSTDPEARCTCHLGSVCGEACRVGRHHAGCVAES